MEPDHTVHHTLDMQLNIFSINRFSIAHAKKNIPQYLHTYICILKLKCSFIYLFVVAGTDLFCSFWDKYIIGLHSVLCHLY